MSATRDGPMGLRFTGTVGGRRGYGVPSRLTDIVGGDRTIEFAGSQLLDPTQPDTTWDATLRAERRFEAGDVEIRLVGEGLVSFGRAPLSTGSGPAGSEWRTDPQHLTGRAVRLGLVVEF